MKIGRNDPCFCGSGKKYKKCCIDKAIVIQPSDKFARLRQADPAFSPRSYVLGRIAGLNERLAAEPRSEELDAGLMELAGDLLDDLDGARLHAVTPYGEGFRPAERRLLEALANRLWGGLVLGGFEEQDILRPLLGFASQALANGLDERQPVSGAVLTLDEDGELLRWETAPFEGAGEPEGFELEVKADGE
ncbi:SEC-C metal-binding domain-containing protein [Saccharibacillus sp. CPCC 101409]|uniref:SEC-C metal-binding domain-containing protein n=1 Tax=Saccharibacillus sp. CPCC 101409 TaxID=3058041 RepID=UPI002673807F|nr:SEC-C metal-binding domain-containing protein [Saccharibacillus sp. CPCC 101409]MDO3409842.1 SEC-C metal-binding domain-containing protein [Saccharibacillus sp. CPCC 101409]